MAFLLDWVELAVRWVHVIAGVAWIGTSFYFNWLNDRLRPVAEPGPGEVGELWSVHGGAFYRAVKHDRVPRATLTSLHWFKWEAYLTWLSGFSLLVLVYYLGADVFLLDPGRAPVSPGAAVAIGVALLPAGWLVYDRLCRSPLGHRPAALAGAGLGLLAALAIGLSELYSGRAAYMHVGALLGSIMAFNVFSVIIPAHAELVRAVEEGREPEPAMAAQAAVRSRHNNYFTLPVLFVMISSHYPITYGHAWGWGILLGLFLVGVATRHGFNLRNRGRAPGWWLAAAALGLLALALVSRETRGGGRAAAAAPAGAVSWADVREILVARCVTCHAEEPAHRLFDAPPGGIRLETAEQVRGLISRIRAVTVESSVMPLGNFTGMTDEERAALGAWIDQGAHTDR